MTDDRRRSGYERLVRPLLFHLDPETAHHLALRALRLAPHIPGGLLLLRSFAPNEQPISIFGLNFRNQIGLAAGFDKDGVAVPGWEALGFGFVEIGTVTARPQPGNPRPRIFRYPQHEALINRLGFNNDGADVIAARLRKLRESGGGPKIPVGVNIGKSKLTPIDKAASDYLYSFRQLRDVADYIALNVSSPNTPGLRSLQERDALSDLLRVIAEENSHGASPKAVLLKIAPDLSNDAIEEIVAACEQHAVAGIIATNTALDHSPLGGMAAEEGGLSGKPLRERSTAVVRLLRARTRLPIIGVGGIFDAASAREKFDAGAQLLQVYTGLVYRGPGLLRDLALQSPASIPMR